MNYLQKCLALANATLVGCLNPAQEIEPCEGAQLTPQAIDILNQEGVTNTQRAIPVCIQPDGEINDPANLERLIKFRKDDIELPEGETFCSTLSLAPSHRNYKKLTETIKDIISEASNQMGLAVLPNDIYVLVNEDEVEDIEHGYKMQREGATRIFFIRCSEENTSGVDDIGTTIDNFAHGLCSSLTRQDSETKEVTETMCAAQFSFTIYDLLEGEQRIIAEQFLLERTFASHNYRGQTNVHEESYSDPENFGPVAKLATLAWVSQTESFRLAQQRVRASQGYQEIVQDLRDEFPDNSEYNPATIQTKDNYIQTMLDVARTDEDGQQRINILYESCYQETHEDPDAERSPFCFNRQWMYDTDGNWVGPE